VGSRGGSAKGESGLSLEDSGDIPVNTANGAPCCECGEIGTLKTAQRNRNITGLTPGAGGYLGFPECNTRSDEITRSIAEDTPEVH
jgi:hypothetical protein